MILSVTQARVPRAHEYRRNTCEYTLTFHKLSIPMVAVDKGVVEKRSISRPIQRFRASDAELTSLFPGYTRSKTCHRCCAHQKGSVPVAENEHGSERAINILSHMLLTMDVQVGMAGGGSF